MFGIAALFLCPASQSTGFDADTIETLLTNTEFNACIMLIYTVTCIVFMGIWYYRSCGGNYLPKPSLTFHPLQFLSIILLIPGMQFFSGYLTSAVSLLFPNWLSQYEKLMETAGLDSDIGLFMFIYAVILGPVCEELVFRGVTMRLVRRALPFWAANLMQAVLFGIFHMNWIQGIYAFVLGLVLGWICEKGGSIYFSMFFHILFNFWGTIIGPLLNNLKETDLLGIIIFLFTIVSLVLGFSLFRLGTKWRDQKAARLMAAPDHDDHSKQLNDPVLIKHGDHKDSGNHQQTVRVLEFDPDHISHTRNHQTDDKHQFYQPDHPDGIFTHLSHTHLFRKPVYFFRLTAYQAESHIDQNNSCNVTDKFIWRNFIDNPIIDLQSDINNSKDHSYRLRKNCRNG